VSRLSFSNYDLARAKRYARIRRTGFLAGMATTALWEAGLVATGYSARLRERIGRGTAHEELTDAAHIGALSVQGWFVGLPVRYVTGHLIERHFEMSKQSTRSWLGNEFKALGVGLAFAIPTATVTFSVMRRRPNDWHIILASAAIPAQLLLTQLAPVLLFPIFNRFSPIEEGELRERIEALAARAGVEINGAFLMNLSSQTERANAFFAGMGATRRIVLGDTLVRSFAIDEVEGVVAHEIGHQVHHDLWRTSAINIASGYLMAFGLKKLVPHFAEATSQWTGSGDATNSASLPLWMISAGTFASLISPFQLWHSRNVETRTDAYAVDLTQNAAAFARGMERLMRQNLDDPYPSRLVTWVFRSHPPTGERIEAALLAAEKQA
jgi:Zn-dependent protease with chaperone function